MKNEGGEKEYKSGLVQTGILGQCHRLQSESVKIFCNLSCLRWEASKESEAKERRVQI